MDDDLNIYLHWPFCVSKCPYCDFNSHVEDRVDHGRWRRALVRELETFAAETAGRTVGSVFFGGGTPSLMEPATAAAIIEAIRRLWPTRGTCEITLEANPTSAEAGRFRAFRAAGVNRLSIGVQSFDDATLRFLGRGHSAAEARRAVEMAVASFERVSLDLIYAVPGQGVDDWSRQLACALALPIGHLSAYQLTVAPGTPFHRARIAEAGDEPGADLFETTRETLRRAGLPAYEISNHARAGEECRHNLAIWRGGDYLAIGPGAEGRLNAAGGCAALTQHRPPQRWLEGVEARGHGLARRQRLTGAQRHSELVMLGLRLAEGIDRERFTRRAGRAIEDVLDGEGLHHMRDLGLIELNETALRATEAGQQRLDWVLARLLA